MADFKTIKPYLSWVFRIAGTGLFLKLILRSADINEIQTQINRLSVVGFIFLFVLFLFIQFITSYRWKILLAAGGIKEKVWDLFISVLYGQTINQILPSSIGGDSVRIAYLMNRHPKMKSESLSATFLDRFLGFFALLIILLFTLPFVDDFSIQQKTFGIILLGVALALVIIVYLGRMDGWIERVIEWKSMPKIIRRYLNRFWQIFQEYRVRKNNILTALLLSLFTQGITIISHYITFRLLAIDVPLLRLFIVFPVVILVVALPISIGGIGVREAALASMLEISSNEVLTFTIIRYSFFILLPILLFIFSIIQGVLNKKNGRYHLPDQKDL